MIIVCKKPTKKLVKGLRYEVGNIYNDGTNNRWQEGTVEIIGVGRFVVDAPDVKLEMPGKNEGIAITESV